MKDSNRSRALSAWIRIPMRFRLRLFFSLTPRFSGVFRCCHDQNRFNGLSHTAKTVETVPARSSPARTPLKQGVNERNGARLLGPREIFFVGPTAAERQFGLSPHAPSCSPVPVDKPGLGGNTDHA